MGKLLEILGRAMKIDTADLIWHWFEAGQFCQKNENSLQFQQLEQIIDRIGEMKLESAEKQLRLYLFEYPSCIYGRMASAAVCLHENKIQNAIEELNSVYMRQPNNTMALYVLGHCYEQIGKESEAVEFYQDCLKFKNFLQLPRQRLAAIYFKNGQLEKTEHEYELLKAEYPDDISTLLTLGHLYIANAKYSQAIETFNTAILTHPDNFYAEDKQLDELIQDGQLHEALEQVDYLLQQQTGRVDLIVKRGHILSKLGDTVEAISQYEKAISVCPDSLEATIRLGTQYLQIHQHQQAARQFNRAVELNDQIVDAYIGLAIAHNLAGNVPEALGTLSLAAAIQPNSSLLFAETATLQFRENLTNDFSSASEIHSSDLMEEVISAHRQQIAAKPRNPDLHYRLGVLMMSVGRLSDAVELFQTALEINPTYYRSKSKLAVCLLETDQEERAIGYLNGPEHIDKDSLELHYKTALLYCDKVKFASSLMNLEHYMETNFATADVAVNISIVLQNLELLDRASAMWENLSDTASQAMNTDYL